MRRILDVLSLFALLVTTISSIAIVISPLG